MQMNCMSQCRQKYMIQYCGCTIDAFFRTGNESNFCSFEDLKCLLKFNREKFHVLHNETFQV
jgi:hypothetical protein